MLKRLGENFDETLELATANLRVRGVPHKEGLELASQAQVRFSFGLTEALLKSYDPEPRARALATLIMRMLHGDDLKAFVATLVKITEDVKTPPAPNQPVQS